MKTTCSHVQGHLSAFLDGRLDTEVEAAVTDHLKRCASCRQELSGLEKLVRTIGEIPPARAPADFGQRLFTRLEEETTVQRFLRKLFLPLRVKLPVELATAAVAVLAIYFMVQQPGFRGKAADQSINMAENRQVPAVTSALPAPPATPEEEIRRTTDKALAPLPPTTTGSSPVRGGAQVAAAPKKRKTALFAPSSPPASEVQVAPPVDALPGSLKLKADSGPIELTLVLKGGAKADSDDHLPAAAPEKESAPAVARLEGKTQTRDRQVFQSVPATDAPAETGLAESWKAGPEGLSVETAEARVRSLAAGLGATVAPGGESGYSDAPVTLQIDIPAARFAMFCRRLQSVGTFESPPPDIAGDLSSTVRMLVTLSPH